MSEEDQKRYWRVDQEERRFDFQPKQYQVEKVKAIQPAPGVRMRGIIGGRLMANFVYLDPNIHVPEHEHHQEQLSVILEGEMELIVNKVPYLLKEGDVFTIPPHALHEANTNEKGCVLIDMFTPPRLYTGAPEVIEP